jgi:glycosyltransferase involved in cell wall biosynthesis
MRQLIRTADAVVCDTEQMVSIVRRYSGTLAFSAPFGHSRKLSVQNESIRVGLLNHTADMNLNNFGNRQMLKRLKEIFLIYGEPIDGLECEIALDFDDFAARCDILLLPSIPNSINSVAYPLSVMYAGAAVLATNIGGYYSLSPASGVQLVDAKASPKTWADAVAYLQRDGRRLDQLKQFNAKFARRVSEESMVKIRKLEVRFSRVTV